MPSDGLLVAGGIGEGLKSGVDSFMRSRDFALRQSSAEDERKNRRLQMGLLAQKEGFDIDDAGNLTESAIGREKREKDSLSADAKRRLDLAHALYYERALKAGKGLVNGVQLTEGEKATDRTYGKDYAARVSSGGYSAAEKKLEQLKSAVSKLKNIDTASGPIVGLLPKSWRDTILPGGSAVQDEVEQVAQESMKQILGGQFTEREGEGILKRAYNPRQEEGENLTRVGRLHKQLTEALSLQKAADDYFKTHGTMRGFEGKTIQSGDDFDLEGEADKTKAAELLNAKPGVASNFLRSSIRNGVGGPALPILDKLSGGRLSALTDSAGNMLSGGIDEKLLAGADGIAGADLEEALAAQANLRNERESAHPVESMVGKGAAIAAGLGGVVSGGRGLLTGTRGLLGGGAPAAGARAAAKATFDPFTKKAIGGAAKSAAEGASEAAPGLLSLVKQLASKPIVKGTAGYLLAKKLGILD